jgi:hypothetical protein
MNLSVKGMRKHLRNIAEDNHNSGTTTIYTNIFFKEKQNNILGGLFTF